MFLIFLELFFIFSPCIPNCFCLQTCRWNTNYVRDLNRFFIYLAGPSFLDEMEMKTKMRAKCFMLRHWPQSQVMGEKGVDFCLLTCACHFIIALVFESEKKRWTPDWLTGRKCCEYIRIIPCGGRIHNSRVICCAPTNKAKWGINICNYVAMNCLLTHSICGSKY